MRLEQRGAENWIQLTQVLEEERETELYRRDLKWEEVVLAALVGFVQKAMLRGNEGLFKASSVPKG